MSKGNKVIGLFREFKDHWRVPAEGKFVPYKEYGSVFLGVGGDYGMREVTGKIAFSSGCFLIMYYYNIPILAFSAIAAFFALQGYFWSILSMIVSDNLGFVPKKTERRLYILYGVFAALGLLFMVLDFSKIIPFPYQLSDFVATIPGMTMRSVCKIFGVHWFITGYFGIRNIVIRKVFLPKYGRYKFYFYPNVIPCIIVTLLICWLPIYRWYANDQAERIWILYLLFSLYSNYGFSGSAESISHTISPNAHERMLVRCYPEKLGHLFNSVWAALIPIASAYTGGLTNINTYKYILPLLLIVNTFLMWLGLRGVKERIPQPPLEKKKYIPFWDGIDGVLKNKYRWINAVSGMIDALGNGGLAVKNIILIYTWREQGIIYAIFEQFIRFVGNPGAFLAPWIRKRFQYRTLVVFKRIVFALQSTGYILACWFFKDDYFMCGMVMVISLSVGDMLTSALKIADDDMNVRISDYQMYISGERLDGYGGVLGWFTGPFSALISLIIPVLFYRNGFTSDWDVLFVDDIRAKCMIIGVAFDLVGHILCCLPYIFAWDYTDEKHNEVMRVLTERAEAAQAELDAENASQLTTAEPETVV
ncbi:MAG: hypothetical protein GX051_09020 [Clostridiales bacterium]|nr:hypothetical protein [Clostridiales bacterium]